MAILSNTLPDLDSCARLCYAWRPPLAQKMKFAFRKKPTRAQRWALAAGGVLTESNGDPFDSIAMRYSKRTSQVCLADWWDVKDRGSLLVQMAWLRDGGHRTALKTAVAEISQLIAGIPPGEQIQLSKHGEFIVNHLPMLKRLQFVAWDHSRLINVARWGLSSEYITTQEAWTWIKAAAVVIRNDLGSWKDVGDDFILGYRYWALDKIPTPQIIEAYDRLMQRPTSPWLTEAWAIDPDELSR